MPVNGQAWEEAMEAVVLLLVKLTPPERMKPMMYLLTKVPTSSS
jgi:hypothetical protein